MPTGTVTGNVTFDGAPFSNAAVVFMCHETGEAGTVDINQDGTFELEAPLKIGSYTVYLAPRSLGEITGSEGPISMTADDSVPQKYWSESSSDITIEIVEGENDVSVPLAK